MVLVETVALQCKHHKGIGSGPNLVSFTINGSGVVKVLKIFYKIKLLLL